MPKDLLRPELAGLTAYHVPDSRGYVKLDAMENPYDWPRQVVDLWLEALREARLNRYPDPASPELKLALKLANQVPDGAGLLLGNGSDEIIQILLMALKPGSVVMAPEPTFVMYRQISHGLGLPFVGVPLSPDDFALDPERFCKAIETHRPAIIFLAYPNNPTANLFDPAAIDRILDTATGFVVVDEAYAPYAQHTCMERICRHDNVLVMRTLSKLGLAGLRLGFMVGSADTIVEFEKLRLPYNINVLTQLSARFALSHPEVFDEQVKSIIRDRALLVSELRRMRGVRVFESQANFVLLRLLEQDASEVFESLRANGILIKNLHPSGGMLTQCLRVTVGTPEENHRFLECFGGLLG